jgi:hypothetical protein
MTRIDLSKPDPEDILWYKACEGEGCLKIMELPYERYKNIKHCPDCRERFILERKRKYMKQKRESFRSLAYGDTLTLEGNERFGY